jgi:hypothetical protein
LENSVARLGSQGTVVDMALCYKPEGPEFEPPSDRTSPWGYSACNSNIDPSVVEPLASRNIDCAIILVCRS